MTQIQIDRDQVYISCLTYLAAEAERDKNFVVAGILKAATADIYDWIQHGSDDAPEENNPFIDSITAAFLFILQHKSLPEDKKTQMICLLDALEKAKMN